jgi:sulfur-carrier protein adenylyltransferase/sulfurtransferase
VHRQPIYALSDVGKLKVELARAAVNDINPTVQVEMHAARLNADNALELIRAYDVIADCSDNFRSKYLINDAAVLAQKPVVFASVYQYEGQLQVYKPDLDHACLRCLWPEPQADGVVGNCAEAGVLGPVPGAFGTLQALLVLKILLKMSGQLERELLLLDFMNFSSMKIKAPRRIECVAPGCAHIRGLAREDAGIEMVLGSLAAAAECGLDVIDIRTAEEVAAHPGGVRSAGGRHIPMARLLMDPGLLEPAGEVLLVCATGKRSLAAAAELRKRGFAARSLAGGLEKLEH